MLDKNSIEAGVYAMFQRRLLGNARDVIVPAAIRKDGTVALNSLAVSDDGQFLAYAVSEAGSDWSVWKVVEVDPFTVAALLDVVDTQAKLSPGGADITLVRQRTARVSGIVRDAQGRITFPDVGAAEPDDQDDDPDAAQPLGQCPPQQDAVVPLQTSRGRLVPGERRVQFPDHLRVG